MEDAAGKLMQEASRARREDRLSDARRNWAEAAALCREGGQKRELVQALKGLGQLYEEAVALCRRAGDPHGLAHTVRHLGDIHQDAGRVALAEPCYHEALTLYRSQERVFPLDLANALRPLAILKESQGQVEEARRLWEEARDL